MSTISGKSEGYGSTKSKESMPVEGTVSGKSSANFGTKSGRSSSRMPRDNVSGTRKVISG